ncbi:MAG: hypothetical protein S4CHLAM81_12990 [Chlamydiales bacterium]|nr:hypothetical protein [Chlamydiales bacterium]MCH9636074.1 hypothetical protein [Chlamydiales bacterium]MCH9703215.1 glycosyltransferase family 2 protein [Chlamydiota bacterium]
MLIFFFLLSQLFAHELSICAIFQNEAPFLSEWIDYHRAVGVEHFYLYNDRSSDAFYTQLKPYIEADIVELFDCAASGRHFYNQRRAYCRGLKQGKEDKWIAFIDIDEFLLPKQHDSLPQMLKQYEHCWGVSIRWQKFGTSYIWELPKDKLMTQVLIWKAEADYEDNFIRKSIVQPKKLPAEFFDEEYVRENTIDLVHFCQWEEYQPAKMRNLGPLALPSPHAALELEQAQINHYRCRNEKYYRERKTARKARLHAEDFGTPPTWSDSRVEKYLPLYNQQIDMEIYRFIPKLLALREKQPSGS